MRTLGYEVTDHVGGTGIVAVMKNGDGPTVLLRTELDALPVEEKTGLPYASKIHSHDDAGRDVPVMHACGHDLHMAAILGTAAIMSRSKDSWHGTLILIGQPAEETIGGAKAMIADGLLTRFPRPDAVVAMHVGNTLPAGQVGIVSGVYNTSNPGARDVQELELADGRTVSERLAEIVVEVRLPARSAVRASPTSARLSGRPRRSGSRRCGS